MSFATRVLLSLAAGFIVGLAISAAHDLAITGYAAWLEPIGSLWLNALRMTVIPLVVSLLITGVGAMSDAAGSGRIAGQSILLFLILMLLAAVVSAVLTPVVLALWPVGTDAAAALREGASRAHTVIPHVPPLRDWLVGIIPSNPFAAAAQGDMLSLVVFALFFGFAITQISAALRTSIVQFFQAVADSMLVIVRWILWAAPVGIFVLAMGVGQRGGAAAAGALGHYLVIACGASVIATVLLIPVAIIGGKVSPRALAVAAAPPLALAVSTQSSIVCLPVMIEAARSLHVPERVTRLVLPLAVAMFRITSPIVNMSVAVFAAHVYGVSIDPWHLAAGVAVVVVTQFGVVGLPSQISFFGTAVANFSVMGIPTDVLPLLLAIEVIPDLFRTVGNVMGDITATLLMARRTHDMGGAPGALKAGESA